VPKKSLTIDQTLTLLTESPGRIAALTEELSAGQLQTRSTPHEWCVNDILAHLRSCADVWGDCMNEILAKDKPIIKAINPTTWIEGTDYPAQKFHPSFKAYMSQRNELLKILQPLIPKAWSRAATVTGAGKPLERTVFFYAQWLASHERTHVKQIGRIVNTMGK
jgi:hypothetical protein